VSAFLRVAVGAEWYALEVSGVREIAELGDIFAVPGAGPHVMGVCNLRGEVLPVVRLDRLLDAAAVTPRRLVLVEDAGRRAALAVSVADAVEELSEHAAADGGPGTGAVLHDGRLLGVLDPGALLDEVERSIA